MKHTHSLLVLCFALVSLPLAAAVRERKPIALDDVGSGELLQRTAEGYLPLPVVDLAVEIEVTGVMVRGEVTQRFVNPTDERIEVLYVFPLPDGAAVHGMEMRIGERRIVAEVRPKPEAKKVYEEAKAAGRKTALVDKVRGDLFTTRAANINPGETVTVVLRYTEEAEWFEDRFRLRFPLTYTRRFTPPTAIDGPAAGPFPETTGPAVPAASQVSRRPPPAYHGFPTATLRLRLDGGLELEQVDSPTHRLAVSGSGTTFLVTTPPGGIPADRDLWIAWRPVRGDEIRSATWLEERDDGSFALTMVVPPAADDSRTVGLPTETLFVVDVSGSMRGPSIGKAREALHAALIRLRPDDRFNMIRFNQEFSRFADESVRADPANVSRARAWVAGLEAGGGTMIYPALEQALSLMAASPASAVKRIVFLTDGAVGNEQELLAAIARDLGDARLHTLAIGHAPNAYLMRKMAHHGRGLCEFIPVVDDADNRIDRFLTRLDRPVLADVVVTWDGAEPEELFPRRIPDLHAGQPLFVSMKLPRGEAPGGVAVGGWTRDGWVEGSSRIRTPRVEGSGVALRWAQRKVESLMDGLREGDDPERVRQEVTDVGMRFGLVTRYTSLVAVEQRRTAVDASGESLRVSAALPLGGTDRRLRAWTGLALALSGLACWILGRPR